MSKKPVLFLATALFFFSCHVAQASLIINEIMYDLSGSDSTNSKSREWIEIYNPDSTDISIDASKWRIYDGSLNRTINGEADFSVPAGSYVIFAGDKDTFVSDHADFFGVVYDTGITSLNNASSTLKILDQDGNTMDSVTYTSALGGAGDGNSLQKISGSWAGATPTPGVGNDTTSSSTGGAGATTSLSSNSSPQNTTSSDTKIKTAQINVEIKGKTLAFAGIPLILEGSAYGYYGEKLSYGKYFWNFGDGDSKEMKISDMGSVQKFTHTYFYPGEYNVNLEYYINYYGNIPDASYQMTVKVVPAEFLISRVGDEKDFFIELSNNTSYDADISNWILLSKTKSFTIPRNTIIGSKKKITFSPKITNFSVIDKYTLKLMTGEREIVFDYSSFIAPLKPVSIKLEKNVTLPKISVENLPVSSDIDFLEPARVLESDVVKNSSIRTYFLAFVVTIFIGASAGAVYFIRQKKAVSVAGSDFKILDE